MSYRLQYHVACSVGKSLEDIRCDGTTVRIVGNVGSRDGALEVFATGVELGNFSFNIVVAHLEGAAVVDTT